LEAIGHHINRSVKILIKYRAGGLFKRGAGPINLAQRKLFRFFGLNFALLALTAAWEKGMIGRLRKQANRAGQKPDPPGILGENYFSGFPLLVFIFSSLFDRLVIFKVWVD
jgi:hypothetical protein